MLILGVDTSGKQGSIALVECGAEATRTLEVLPLEGGTFSAQLVPQIAALLRKHGLMKDHIDVFAVVSGPGSFTGLRVGLAGIKALAEILAKPIVSISLLETIAVAAGIDGRIAAATDAGRGEIYVGIYDVQNGIASCSSEQVLAAADLASEFTGARLVTPDHKLAEVLTQKAMTVHEIVAPRADDIARIGFTKFRRGETVTPEALDATYIRRSEAEIKFAERNR
jgi:tRNA threonylcarbamoyladenosine biosynthesis protein TsaB